MSMGMNPSSLSYSDYFKSVQENLNIDENTIKNASPKARREFLNAAKVSSYALQKFKETSDLKTESEVIVANTKLKAAFNKLSNSQKKSGFFSKIGRIFSYMIGVGASQSEMQQGLDALKHVLIRDLSPKDG
ncbi:hypothetical protein [Waddlia chondrophila]|uniref:Uncharacterized protein n=1 Tax=Waddlia chondrophila (strain ATCC VR-1470 / WSU 86-1044) TaxID=716544 RepID=D6YW94_WADCW|nr:hypothetical protein [Waddlia chondrophila]ADI38405.1 hypothetical protein wcw_1046 [Waddlia chondrophila WSU 86-1044]